MKKKFDFSGWATKNDIRCADGKTIRKNAFIDDDGKTVPLVWNHQHKDPELVLGHAILENRPEGVYYYATLNNTNKANIVRELVKSGDIKSVSIYANGLTQERGNVLHGTIRELSVVLAAANPGASIDYPIVQHSDGNFEEVYDEAIIHGVDIYEDKETIDMRVGYYETEDEELEHADEAKEDSKGDKTVEEIYETLNDEQKALFNFMVDKIAEKQGGDEAKHSDIDDEEDDEVMKYNVFDTTQAEENTLSHDAMKTIINDGKKYGSLKESFIAHADDYGIQGIEWLFPEDHELNNTPKWIKRDTGWVQEFMGSVSHTPFSRVRTRFADITEDEARAKGYMKGNLKKEEVFSLLKRSTPPQTVYKKQKMDRDDKIDITDFDVIAWLKGEMRMMLDEEIARACLIGDGRLASDDDKISEDHIRPVVSDAELFVIRKAVKFAENATESEKARAVIRAAIKARKDYKGAGNPKFFTVADWHSDMLLIEDTTGRDIYKSDTELCTKMRVSKIVEVPVMENLTIQGKKVIGIIFNPTDYTIGADKGGAVNMFEDFDIDYNQEKYLIETRCSGAITVPYSAIVLFEDDVPETVTAGGVTRSKLVE